MRVAAPAAGCPSGEIRRLCNSASEVNLVRENCFTLLEGEETLFS